MNRNQWSYLAESEPDTTRGAIKLLYNELSYEVRNKRPKIDSIKIPRYQTGTNWPNKTLNYELRIITIIMKGKMTICFTTR